MLNKNEFLMEEAGDKGGGGAAVIDAGVGADKGGAAVVDDPSLLSQAAGVKDDAAAAVKAAADAKAAGAADPLAWIPEKYRVAGADGKVDVQASAQKINEARAALEKRMGETGLPPDKPEGYKPDKVLAALKEKSGQDVKLDDAQAKNFQQLAHKSGLSQTQYEAMLGAYFENVQTMVDQAFDKAMATGKAALIKVWGAPESDTFKGNMGQALRAFNTYMPAALRTRENMDAVGNNPLVLQLLATVGKELKEDTGVAGDTAATDDIQKLMNSESYWNKKHAEHGITVRKVNEFFARGGKITPKAA